MTLDSTPTNSNSFKSPVQTSSLAIASLVSGIASWFIIPILGAIIAVITGHMAKKEISESGGQLTGEEMANIGLVLGYVHLALTVCGICLIVLFVTGLLAVIFGSVQWSSAYIRIVP